MTAANKRNTLRAQLQQRRYSLSKKQQRDYSKKICQQIIAKSTCFQKAQHIAFYTPVKGEANPLPLQKMADKSFYLPVLSLKQAFHLIFVKIDKNTRYRNNKYAIPEPIYNAEDIIAAENLDLIIMPLVAMDRQGNRLGMGGGYYDRSLAFKKEAKTNAPQLLGFAYDFQLVDKLTAKAWDVPLDFMATNKEFICL